MIPWLYRSRNPSAHQPRGSCQIHMPIDSIGEFENENFCQINIFGYYLFMSGFKNQLSHTQRETIGNVFFLNFQLPQLGTDTITCFQNIKLICGGIVASDRRASIPLCSHSDF